MARRQSYDRQLRSIGQSLEAQRIQVFELTRQGEQYSVRGEPEKETSLLATLRNWQMRLRSEGMTMALMTGMARMLPARTRRRSPMQRPSSMASSTTPLLPSVMLIAWVPTHTTRSFPCAARKP